jgi:acetyl/propionyl-CoA carboxylase alpha subunit
VIRKLLIANRGEIACRIIRICREMGIRTVAVYSDADVGALHVRQADEAVHIGAAPASESYLRIDKIIAAAHRTGADAVHPGYGFLAENAAFARACVEAGLIFVGPPAEVIEKLGSKIEAKRIAQKLGIPVVPGYNGDDQSDVRFVEEAERIGYPVMIKASAGGGGKGMREVHAADELVAALAASRREAQAAFGDETLLLEKRILRPRHVEIQIMGDMHGEVISLGERECSIQRRHQKLIEESPSVALDEPLRAKIAAAAVALGKAVGYVNAGTVEFILDADKNFYFLEVNARLQVEHPVTEMTTYVNLVRWQLKIANGKKLDQKKSNHRYGYAMEVRICAEDPGSMIGMRVGEPNLTDAMNGVPTPDDPVGTPFLASALPPETFMPMSGVVLQWQAATNDYVRVDSGIDVGSLVSPNYDSLLAKIIVWGANRAECLSWLRNGISSCIVLGVRTNIDFLRRVINHPEFVAGDYDTGFIDRHPELLPDPPPPAQVVIAAALAQHRRQVSTGGAIMAKMAAYQPPLIGFRNNPYRPQVERFRAGDVEDAVGISTTGGDGYHVTLGDSSHLVQLVSYEDAVMRLSVDGSLCKVTLAHDGEATWWLHNDAGTFALRWLDPLPAPDAAVASEGSLRAPMPGSIRAVLVQAGQTVQTGEALMVMEAMKMEHRISAPHAGVVTTIHYEVGQFAPLGAVLLEISPTL